MKKIIDFQNQFEQYLSENPINGRPLSLYQPADYIMSLGGKRLRPIFTMLGCDLYGKPASEALRAAMAIEVFHNFTLVHDDIMDKAATRRGQPTVHEKYGLNTAILSGDVMLIQAYQYILDYGDPVLIKAILDVMNTMAFEVCEGQQSDMDFEKSTDVSISNYLDMITQKTSVLMGAAIRIGAIIAGADEKNQKHIYEFAKYFGIAFQLQDDMLDVFGTHEQVGKRIGGDIVQNKKTYLFIKSLELASTDQKALLEELYFTSDHTYSDEEKIQLVTDIFKDLHVSAYSKEVIDAYRDLSVSHLNACDISPEKKSELTTFINKLIMRES